MGWSGQSSFTLSSVFPIKLEPTHFLLSVLLWLEGVIVENAKNRNWLWHNTQPWLSTKPISRASAFFLNDLQLFLSYLLLFLPPLKNQKQKFDQHRIIFFPNYPGNEDEDGCLILCEEPLLLSMVNTPRGPFNLTSLSLSLCLQVSHNWMVHHCSSHISMSL